ncbi:MAG: 23S rRNA (pseudouridine(1915)-N(3))-methyltransferase RlmH [Clostridia bacterium]|nr:23S rRNA (pseudouridine(1915)-N(3))-methyltransferase RlmH [Clostridia bacterium]MDD7701002.1 23S rRNA (pseudouridine(1915)-N(3))-methyltransferase RlmH [Eubacteriales bacterium]MDY2827487.1 23S rRNA (pseudouridine(1915)-N(3))-methyltransferase RlmH [Eubacteriales bacterium]
MFRIHLIVTGNLKERYWREAAAEYEKRLSAFARLTVSELKESRLPENPGPAEIATALEKEADAILSLLSPHAFVVALCVEGKMLSSEELAATLSQIMREEGELTLIIGSSHGLSPRVKERADLRLSFSRLTFPHQMMRVLTLEAVYRALTILAGRKYHK